MKRVTYAAKVLPQTAEAVPQLGDILNLKKGELVDFSVARLAADTERNEKRVTGQAKKWKGGAK